MFIEGVELFAFTTSRGTNFIRTIVQLVITVGPVLLGALIVSAVISGLLHLLAVFRPVPEFAFDMVYRYVFPIVFVIGIIWICSNLIIGFLFS